MQGMRLRGMGYGALALGLMAVLIGAGELRDLKTPRTPPEQPLPFSHKTHAGAGLACKSCHPIPEPGDFATIAPTSFCMGCHSSIKADSPHIQKLAELHKEGRRIRWAPVYRIPDWVSFSHKIHTAIEGVSCESCHGQVAQQDALGRVKDLSMASCMECHRVHNASNQCNLCHDQR